LLNTTSAAQSVTLTNTGAATLSISSVTVRGPFSSTNTCGPSLAAGASCDFSVMFKPAAVGKTNGLISVVDGASLKPQVIELFGAGTVVELTPPTLNFPNQKVGTQSAPMTVSVTNTGSTSISFTEIALGHEDVEAFTERNNCGIALGPGASCTLTVTFRPNKAGVHHGIVHVYDNGGGGEQIVNLFGTGD
jgi:archaellum component FlaF (FlaF/FlaG flagellin family)